MKHITVLSLLSLAFFNHFGVQAAAVPYDTTQFAWWSVSTNDSGETAVAFVRKADTAGQTAYPVLYQKFEAGTSSAVDTILLKWNRDNYFSDVGYANIEIVLDNDGWAHFICNGDSGRCDYFSNRADLKWRLKYVLSNKNSKANSVYSFGRRNRLAVSGDRIDLVTSADYRAGGGWPFSSMFRIFGKISDDSLKNERITADTGIYAEEIYDFKISNRFDRLSIAYALGQYGGWNADRLIVSKTYPVIDTNGYYYREMRSAWAAFVTPIKIVSEDASHINISVSGYIFPLFIGNSGIFPTAVLIKHANVARKSVELKIKNIFDLRGRILSAQPGTRLPAGIYFSQAANEASRTTKRLQIGR
ncbi:MAG: hypothetical protein PHO56_05135 [Patescibacteria group bacterium]|nr:hypothetical protein [Patescibacteria group bacterium]